MFDSPLQDVKLAASICLGNVTIGNPDFFLDKVFALVQQSQEKKYLFLNTLREIIIENPECLMMYLERVLELLMVHASHADENIRSIVAEALGRLTPAYQTDICQAIEDALKSTETVKKATVARSVKFSGPRLTEKVVLMNFIVALLCQETDPDPEVKKNAIEGITSIIHTRLPLIKNELRQYNGNIFNFAITETTIRKELIEEVELGPFKHKVDRGLPIRRAAYQLIETMYEHLSSEIDINKVVDTLVTSGLTDTAEECVTLTLNILAKLCTRSGVVVIARMDQLITEFEKLFKANLRLITSKQSQERAQNILRAVIRVVYILQNSAELKEQPSQRFDDFYKNILLANADAKNLYEKVAASYKSNQMD